MGRLTLKGKDAARTAKPAPPPRTAPPRVHPADVPIDWNDPYADPFPPVDTSVSPELRASECAESAIWVQQWVSECAAGARKLDRLRAKLHDPKLADSPHRPEAVAKARQLDVDVINLVRDILWTEAQASRIWETLTPAQRLHADCAGQWMTEPEAPDLIGAAFLRIGSFETWPKRWKLHRLHVNDWPMRLVDDMKNAGVWAWEPSPFTGPDPFGGDIVHNLGLARELEKRR